MRYTSKFLCMDSMINQMVHLPGGSNGEFFGGKKKLIKKNMYKKIEERDANGHAQKVRIVHVLTN